MKKFLFFFISASVLFSCQLTNEKEHNSYTSAQIVIKDESLNIIENESKLKLPASEIGQRSSQIINIMNSGDQNLILTNIECDNTNFVINKKNTLTTLGKECHTTVEIIFDQINSEIENSGTLSISSNSQYCPTFNIYCNVTGTNSLPIMVVKQQNFNVISEGNSYTFKNTSINSKDYLLFHIENIGGDVLDISSIIPDDSENFYINLTGTTLSLLPKESTTFEIVFFPRSIAPLRKKSAITISSNYSDNREFIFSVEGLSEPEKFSDISCLTTNDEEIINSTSLNPLIFKNQVVSTGNKYLVKIKNLGNKNLNIFNISSEDFQNFSIDDSNTEKSLIENEETFFYIIFSPDDIGTFRTKIKISSDSLNNSTFAFNISANSVSADKPTLQFSISNQEYDTDDTVQFTDTFIYNGSTLSGFIKNIGSQTLIISNMTLSDEKNFDFFYTGKKTIDTITLNSGDIKPIDFMFNPTKNNYHYCLFSFNTNDVNNSFFEINLFGNAKSRISPLLYHSPYNNVEKWISNGASISKGTLVMDKYIQRFRIDNSNTQTNEIQSLELYTSNQDIINKMVVVKNYCYYEPYQMNYYLAPYSETFFEIHTDKDVIIPPGTYIKIIYMHIPSSTNIYITD